MTEHIITQVSSIFDFVGEASKENKLVCGKICCFTLKLILRDGVMVARLPLEQEIGVRIPVPQQGWKRSKGIG